MTQVGVRAVVVDLLVVQSATLRARFVWRHGGVQQSLADHTVRLDVARRRPGAPLFSLSSSTEGEITLEPDDFEPTQTIPEATGVIDVFFPVAKTALLRRDAVYDLWVIGPTATDDTIRLFEGAVLVDAAAVRAA